MAEKTKKSKPTVSSNIKPSDSVKFPIACLGASAGGLEAFELFLRNIPENTGIGYVFIQHLDPNRKGMLPELLQRMTTMKVFQVKDGMKVQPDTVYVIPPNKNMSILKGILYLSEPHETRGLRLPIDFFFRSLADDLNEQAIGIVLSGMGSDGSIGCRAIKEKNGKVLVQEPTNAKFDSMPRSAINSVSADSVAPANDLPKKMLSLLKNRTYVKLNIEEEQDDQSSLEKIITILREQTGNDFSLYKKNTLYRRIERRMNVHNIDKIIKYVQFLAENPKEVNILFKELLIGVTNFFRDVAVWEKINETILPELISTKRNGTILRAWVTACSTGEEAYSLAILFKETIEKIKPHKAISLQIFATDLDEEAIETARKGVFSKNIDSNISASRLKRFFTQTDHGYRINTEIREMVIFAKHNIILHPPFTKLDILTCRNLLIYMDTQLQKKLLELFHYCLNKNGYIVLGSAETLGTQSHIFTPIDAKLKIYKRSESTVRREIYDFPSSYSKNNPNSTEKELPMKDTPNIQTLADQLLLQHFSPPGVLVNENGDIIYISGKTGKYLEPAVGKANMNIFAMLREGLQTEFLHAFRQAIIKKTAIDLKNVIVGISGGMQQVHIKIQWIDKPEQLKGMVMIVFNDLPISLEDKPTKKRSKSSNIFNQLELEKEVQHVREEMQNTLEEVQTSQEELKTSNEEFQSTNEELQSTNEELTTSKEEMQSLNEELQTVNAELMSKVEEFTQVNNDMKNLLNSTEIATLFLDKELNIRRYTDQATKIFKLRKTDIDRPLTDLVSDLIYPEMVNDSHEVLKTLVFVKKQIPTKDGRWFSIRIMPYRTFDDRIDGLVITFFNITDLKELEAELNEKEQMHQLILMNSSDIIIQISANDEILEFNRQAEKFFGIKLKEVLNQKFTDMFVRPELRKKISRDFDKFLKDEINYNYHMEIIAANGKNRSDDWSVNILKNNIEVPGKIVLIKKQLD
ncbi:MAG: PAS domain S-box protein [Paludibacter sp.]|nr:PAS domain S-box protein [Paludibacter sp.]